ncbi:hypothetical protein JKP88DRAFT_253362 [Tribonema minus]|uniref:Secreted protein n=1 Tax=Tribonema minus TaxID=303371 RepID=A0A835ZA80_9STRA|nr:hypothetical protein JKP88DRAFT_253362 [Tribonema minus]
MTKLALVSLAVTSSSLLQTGPVCSTTVTQLLVSRKQLAAALSHNIPAVMIPISTQRFIHTSCKQHPVPAYRSNASVTRPDSLCKELRRNRCWGQPHDHPWRSRRGVRSVSAGFPFPAVGGVDKLGGTIASAIAGALAWALQAFPLAWGVRQRWRAVLHNHDRSHRVLPARSLTRSLTQIIAALCRCRSRLHVGVVYELLTEITICLITHLLSDPTPFAP